MEQKDVGYLLQQINCILQNEPIIDEMKSPSDDLAQLQAAIAHLAGCISESNEFLHHLSVGNLEAAIPDRHNYVASYMKELHSGLKHLAWQADRVANGDYNQKVSFMGEFSDSFNKMITQLDEREARLKSQAYALEKSMDLLIAVMDGMHDWVFVTEKGSCNVLYVNHCASEHFYNTSTKKLICGREQCTFVDHLCSCEVEGEAVHDYDCPINGKSLRAKSFTIQWNGKMAYAHFITDITSEKIEKIELENMAFKDELTGLYNRRYCIQKLKNLIYDKKEFTICLLDLDGLKRVNDTFGHAIGDEYITTVTAAMQQIECPACMMCRVGGDEFVMIMPDISEPSAKKKVLALESAIALIKRSYDISISCGTFFVASNMHLLPETVLERADEKMYAEKCRKYAER